MGLSGGHCAPFWVCVVGPPCLVRRMRTNVPCAMMEVSSSAVTAVPGPSTWLACPHLCGRSPGEQSSPSMLAIYTVATLIHRCPHLQTLEKLSSL